MSGARPIPQSYSTLLSGMIQLFGDMDQEEYAFEGVNSGIGIFMADSGLYQRSYPDGIVEETSTPNLNDLVKGNGKLNNRLQSLSQKIHSGEDCSEESKSLLREVEKEDNFLKAFIVSGTFPNFFGMTLPLLKYGLPVRPVQLDNVRRFPGYLDDYANLILSYEYMKPEGPDINNAVAGWVRSGGTLIYIGDGSDPYHAIRSWWNTGKADYQTPAEHLFEMLGLSRKPADGTYPAGKGRIAVWNMAPARLCLNGERADAYRELVKKALLAGGSNWDYANHLTLRRGPYIISAVMDESISDKPKTFHGLFADMLENDYAVVTEKTIRPDQNAVLFDFSKIYDTNLRIIGCSARAFTLDCSERHFSMDLKAADRIKAFVRIRLPKKAAEISAVNENSEAIPLSWEWDDVSRTALFSYNSKGLKIKVYGVFS